jgi:Kef-type K+ transport system membrane component KefB
MLAPGANTLYHVLLALAVVILCARTAGWICKRIHQPPVIGEVLAGILLGPSLLGRVAPTAMETLFPPPALGPLGIIAQLGVVLFMFLVGVELNLSSLGRQSRTAFVISVTSIIVPFVLGALLSVFLFKDLAPAGVTTTAFTLFVGVSLSVTAFPVLARILTDRGMQRTPLGAMALACAAFGDAAAWCLLALLVGVVRAQLHAAALTFVLTLVFIALMVVGIRPIVSRWVKHFNEPNGSDQPLMAGACIGLLASALATEWIGIHALFGAFLFGALIRHDSRVAELLHHKLYDFVVVMLLPAFFALTGLRTQIGLVEGTQWLTCGLIILVAFAGKFGGATLAARVCGQSWRDASALGILMNTRGLMELIVLNVGLDLGVISPRLFAMLVLMALVTTFTTAPILDRIMHRRWAPAGER